MSLKILNFFQLKNKKEEKNDPENFFKSIGIDHIYRWNDSSDTGYSQIKLDHLNDKVLKNKGELFVFVWLPANHDLPDIGEKFVSPSFDLGRSTFLIRSISFTGDDFLIKCEIVGSDIGINTDGDDEFSIRELRRMIEQEKKYIKNKKAKKIAPSDYR